MASVPPPEAPDLEERTLLSRLRWIARVHVIGGILLVARATGDRVLVATPHAIAIAVASTLVVIGWIAASAWAVARWERSRFTPLRRLFRVGLNGLAILDLLVLSSVVAMSGGVDSLALPLFPLPLMLFGSFLPRWNAYALAAGAAAILSALLIGESAGWFVHVCPAIDGLACTFGSRTVLGGRLATSAMMMFLASFLTSFIGSNLRRQEADAERLADERTALAARRARFIVAASHEFRTPLATILASSDALSRYGTRMAGAQRTARLGKIEQALTHMAGLLNTIVKIGQFESGRLPCRPERIDVTALCRDVVRDLESTAPRTGRLIVDAAARQVQAELDPRLVREILHNLLANAVAYSAPDSVVTCEVRHDAAHVSLRVHDHGIGIPAVEQARLFEPFHRGGNVGRVAGAGLGLVLTKTAVDLHGGTISVESREGHGTTVTVTLPAHAESAVERSAA